MDIKIIGLLLNDGLTGIIFAFLLLIIPITIAQWKLFKKAGKNGWESIIPIYNTWILVKISGLNWWYFLGFITFSIKIGNFSLSTGIISYLVYFLIFYNIAKKTNQNTMLYSILGTFFPYIAILILGFSKNINYDSSIEVSPNGIFGSPKPNNNSNNTVQNQQIERYCLGCGQRLDNNVQFCTNCGKKVEDPQNTQM